MIFWYTLYLASVVQNGALANPTGGVSLPPLSHPDVSPPVPPAREPDARSPLPEINQSPQTGFSLTPVRPARRSSQSPYVSKARRTVHVARVATTDPELLKEPIGVSESPHGPDMLQPQTHDDSLVGYPPSPIRSRAPHDGFGLLAVANSISATQNVPSIRDIEAPSPDLESGYSSRSSGSESSSTYPSDAEDSMEATVGKEGQLNYAKLYIWKSLNPVDQEAIGKPENICFIPEKRESLVNSIDIGSAIMYRYEVLQFLGSGTFGQVVKVIDHCDPQLTAYSLKRLKTRGVEYEREVKIMKRLKNAPNVVQIIDDFSFRNECYILMEYMDYSLHEGIESMRNEGTTIKIARIQKITAQILFGLDSIHKAGLSHNDIKPQNILINFDGGVQIADFGSSQMLNPADEATGGTLRYSAPENVADYILTDTGDMWSLGMVVAEMYLGLPLMSQGSNWDGIYMLAAETLALTGKVEYPQSYGEGPFRKVAEKSFAKYGGKFRSLGDKVQRHPGDELRDFNLMMDFIKQCLKLDPHERLDIQSALNHPFIALVGVPRFHERRRTANEHDSHLK